MSFTSPDLSRLSASFAALRARRPLVHCVTNQVASNLTANALLCVGASPLMAETEDEVAVLAPDVLLINLGMQTPTRMQSARLAIAAACERGTRWVLDPVAAGALASRTTLALELAACGPAVIKGNASEIIALAGGQGGLGTDATVPALEARASAEALARQVSAVTVITGAEDIVTDGQRTMIVKHGHPMLAQISGLECIAGALIAACLTVETDAVVAATNALTALARLQSAPRCEQPDRDHCRWDCWMSCTGSGQLFDLWL